MKSPFLDNEVFPANEGADSRSTLAGLLRETHFHRTAIQPPSPEAERPAEEGPGRHAGEPERDAAADRVERQAAPTRIAEVIVVDENDHPMTQGEYRIHQGGRTEKGQLNVKGSAPLGAIDPTRPFLFELLDQACTIHSGAFLNPDDPKIEYGGVWFDWTIVRDARREEPAFWRRYLGEMKMEDTRNVVTGGPSGPGRGVDHFWQHEHITRRPIQAARSAARVKIRAAPVKVRTGPLLRYTDHQSAVVWLETDTPCMVRIRCRKAGGGPVAPPHYSSTVRVGGRYFAAVEVTGLEPDVFFEYAFDLAPLPGVGPIPERAKLAAAFPRLTSRTTASMRRQLQEVTRKPGDEWIAFRALREQYDTELRFATGSCRWYPGDVKQGKDWRPDMLDGFGQWLRGTAKERWPHFLFFGGDQIYSDEIGDKTAESLIRGRLAARRPGPTASGAWAGRFGERFVELGTGSLGVAQLEEDFKKLAQLYRRHGNISLFPSYFKSQYRKDLLEYEKQILALERKAGFRRPLYPYLKRAARDRDRARFVIANGLWNIPLAPDRLPAVTTTHASARVSLNWARRYTPPSFVEVPSPGAIRPVGDWTDHTLVYPFADGGRHVADFAEYSYLYERAWTTTRNGRCLLASVPTFLMFDDHEVTDDWNFDAGWVRMLHHQGDPLQLWPKTITDALVSYWMYQGWCNRAPSQWGADPRAVILERAREDGTDALPALRTLIRERCLAVPSPDPAAPVVTGGALDWHYRLPFDPPFLVPDCRSRKYLHPSDDRRSAVDLSAPPKSQTIDGAQIKWMRGLLAGSGKGKSPGVVFLAPSTPLLMIKKVMDIQLNPQRYAGAWQVAEPVTLFTLVAGVGGADPTLVHEFRRARDLEHMIRDNSWHDLWGILEDMRRAGSGVRTLVLVSGDVHHSYCMTANLSGAGRPRPEILQITCSGLQTTIRRDWQKDQAEWSSISALGSVSFGIGGHRLHQGFLSKRGTGPPDVALFENSIALVNVRMAPEVKVDVEFLVGVDFAKDRYVYSYTSGPEYMRGNEPAFRPQEIPELPVRSDVELIDELTSDSELTPNAL